MGFLGIGTFGGVSGHVILGRYLWKKGMEGRNEGGKEFTVPFSTFSLRPALLVCWCTPLPTSPQADHGSEGAVVPGGGDQVGGLGGAAGACGPLVSQRLALSPLQETVPPLDRARELGPHCG